MLERTTNPAKYLSLVTSAATFLGAPCWRLYPLLFCAFASHAWAGGSGLNVAVVVNQNSSNSVELGNYYCEKRLVPPQNLLRTSWAGGNIEWTNSDFDSVILNPLLAMLSARGLTNQIDYVVLCMDFPYRVVNTGLPTVSGTDSTTSALFYGFKADLPALPPYTPASCNLPIASSNAYAGSEGIFRSTPPTSPNSNSFLVTMITSSNLAQAKAIIDQGVASDGAFPLQTVYLGKSDDRLRNVRYALFDNAIFDTRLRGNVSLLRTNLNEPTSLSNILGYENGRQFFSIGPALFFPGAMADSLTSYGGSIFENTGHTPLLAFLNAGASGSYGTVVEPCNYFQKFPSPQTYFYQSRGFSLAECYYQSVTNPYQGLLVGEPLAAPFAQASSGLWGNLPANALLSGTTNLLLQFSAGDASHPLQQVDLFLDGMLAQTLTNIPPRQGNVLSVTLNGQSMTSTVLPNDTIKSVAARLVTVLNLPTYTNATKIRASARGDRIELQFFDLSKPGSQVPVAASSSIGSASALTTFISASGASLLDTVAYGLRGYSVTNTPMDGDYLQLAATKTNGQIVTTSVTNTTSGSTLADLAKALINAVNTNLALQSADGIIIEDVNMHEDYPYNVYVYGTNDHSGEFNIRARSPGWPQSQIQIRLSGSPTFTIQPSGVNRLDENLDDLQPRGHLYITAGTTNLPLTFGFNTTTRANGFHELTAVAYHDAGQWIS